MSNIVFFDMDGTIVDLYGVENVFKRLDNGDATPYAEAKAIPNMVAVREYGAEGANGTIVDDDDRVLAKWCGPKVKAVPENKMIK